jgi:hypothetical protein
VSIYATLWVLKFPRYGDYFPCCDWIDVFAEGVPAHIGSPAPGYGYEDGDPYASFLPPAVEVNQATGQEEVLRAVVFVDASTVKGTARSPQEYVSPLLVLTGDEYNGMTFDKLFRQLCTVLRGNRPRVWDGQVKPTAAYESFSKMIPQLS